MTASMMTLILRAVVGHCLILHLVTSLGTACIIIFNYIVVYVHVFMIHGMYRADSFRAHCGPFVSTYGILIALCSGF